MSQKSPAEHERREDLRKPPAKPLWVEYPEYTPRVRDLSLSGAFIEDSRPLRPGRIIRLHITDREGPPLEMKAMVRRVVPDEGMTVEFVEMSDETRRRLRGLVGDTARPEDRLA